MELFNTLAKNLCLSGANQLARLKHKISNIILKIQQNIVRTTLRVRPIHKTILTSIILACIILPSMALARAGGGGGFSSGGGGGFSGGGGGGGGGGDIILLIIWLLIGHPVIGIPVTIIAITFFILSGKQGHSAHISSTIRRGYQAQNRQKHTDGLNKLLQRDPNFSSDSFTERCKKAFPKVQNAWSKQNMTPARHIVSDGIYERFQLQLKMQKECCLRNVMENVQVSSANIIGIQSDAFFDTLHVSITASAIDYLEDTNKNKRINGGSAPETFTEIWSFLRRPGAKTLETPGLIEGFCPNCGNQLEISDSTKCPSCKALVNSGEFDWVLSEITQTEVWSDPSNAPIPGLQQMVAKDPGFNVQHIEDKLSVIFWRLQASEFFANNKYLKKLALPEYLEANRSDFTPLQNGKHKFYADAAIGSVEVAGIELAGANEELDKVHVRVKWSGHQETYEIPSLIKPDWDKSRLKSQDFILVRHKDVTTSKENTLTSSHCPGCGAPQTINTNGACEYCNLAQNDGSSDWVLQDIKPFFTFSANAQMIPPPVAGREPTNIMKSKLSPSDNEHLLQCVIAVMMADGIIDPKEEKALQKMAKNRNITQARLNQLISNVQLNGTVTAPESGNGSENKEFVQALIKMCLADGNVSASEKTLIKALTAHMSYTDVDIDMMIKKERAELYQQAKQALKTARNK